MAQDVVVGKGIRPLHLENYRGVTRFVNRLVAAVGAVRRTPRTVRSARRQARRHLRAQASQARRRWGRREPSRRRHDPQETGGDDLSEAVADRTRRARDARLGPGWGAGLPGSRGRVGAPAGCRDGLRAHRGPPCLADGCVSTSQPVSWLPDRRPSSLPSQTVVTRVTGVQWREREGSPVTVARTAPESHRLPWHCDVARRTLASRADSLPRRRSTEGPGRGGTLGTGS